MCSVKVTQNVDVQLVFTKKEENTTKCHTVQDDRPQENHLDIRETKQGNVLNVMINLI